MAITAGVPTHWCHQLGTHHRLRDEPARREACALRDRDAERQSAVRRRWPALTVAMRALVTSYNEGAGIDVLTVVDYTESESRDLILEVAARGGQTLTMELGRRRAVRAPERRHAGRAGRWQALARVRSQ
jgi:hypothetical protein